nr:amylo-alpha-1,6-glucosidase [Cellulosilyticum ruminicola]
MTPRHGKPVEINALWYNTLKIMVRFEKKLEKVGSSDYDILGERLKESFNKAFWNETDNCLYDVIKESYLSEIWHIIKEQHGHFIRPIIK